MKEKNLKKSSRSDWARVDALRDEDIDFSDISELGETFFRNATIRLPEKKVPVCIRLDHEVVDWFKAGGKGYQSRINAVLKAFMEGRQRDARQPYFKEPPREELRTTELTTLTQPSQALDNVVFLEDRGRHTRLTEMLNSKQTIETSELKSAGAR